MILLAVFAFLLFQPLAESLSTHLSHILKLKCDSLRYRSTYADDRCYFAEFQETNATAGCSSILNGSTAILDVPDAIFAKLMIDKSQFRRGNKFAICVYEPGYKCKTIDMMLRSGKCFVRAPEKMNFDDANSYCLGRGMTIPTPSNYLENQILRDILVKDPAWVQKFLVQVNEFKWSQVTLYARWSTCNRTSGASRPHAVSQNAQRSCDKDTASVIDKNGDWSNVGVLDGMDVFCVQPAVNAFTEDTRTPVTSTTTSTTRSSTTVTTPKPRFAGSVSINLNRRRTMTLVYNGQISKGIPEWATATQVWLSVSPRCELIITQLRSNKIVALKGNGLPAVLNGGTVDGIKEAYGKCY